MRNLVLLFAMMVMPLAACAPRGTLAVLPEDAPPTEMRTVLVATSRTTAPAPDFFGEDRSDQTNYASFEVALPPDRAPGEIEYPRNQEDIDPRTQFLVSSVIRLDGRRQFVRAINAETAKLPPESRDGFVFVHGFNTNSAEGIVRATALAEDTGRQGLGIVYSWPSAGSALRYLDDRESALFARDSFAETLTAVAESRMPTYTLVAHSMGTFVVMDTLRELAQQNRTSVLRKIQAVVLISADLDKDVFRKQVGPVLDAGVPMILLTADDDLALKLSARVRGQGERVGDIKEPPDLEGLNVVVFDLSDVESGDPLKHFKVGASPELLKFLRVLNESGKSVIGQSGTDQVVTVDADALAAATGVRVVR